MGQCQTIHLHLHLHLPSQPRASALSSNIRYIVDLKGPKISRLPQAWELRLPAMGCAAVLKPDASVVPDMPNC